MRGVPEIVSACLPKLLRWIIVLSLTSTSISCAGEDRAEFQPLDCERIGYPCASADVDPEVARAGLRIADGVLDRFNADGAEEALMWLRGQPEVEHAVGDGMAFRFRLTGGRPVWVLTARALGYEADPSASATRVNAVEPTAASLAGLARPAVDVGRWFASGFGSRLPATTGPASVDVVGRDRDGDQKLTDRDSRRALVLDPFHWEWSRLTSYAYREGVEIVRILEGTRGFDHGVVRYLPDHRATESAFTGWDDYDVVHFSGHGHRICEYDGCYSMIFTGDTVSSAGAFDDATLGLGRETGVMEVRDPNTGNLVLRKRHLAIGREWFRHHYDPGDLDGTLIYLSGCGTMNPGDAFLPDFLAPLMGDRGTTAIGWTGVVPGAPAQAAALEFYTEASESLWRTGDVLTELQSKGLTSTKNSAGETVRIRAGSASGEGFSRAPARLAEVIALHVPESVRMFDGPQPRATLRGTPGDSKTDTLSVDVVLNGVRADELDRWNVDLVLRGHVVRQGLQPSAEHKEGDYRYRIPVRDLDLGVDLIEGRLDTLEAVAHLPEKGESRTLAFVELVSSYYHLTVAGDASAQQTGAVTFRGLPAEVPGISSDKGLCLVSIRFKPPRGSEGGPVGVTFGFDGLVDWPLRKGQSYPVAPPIRADDVEYYVLLPPFTPGGARARRAMRSNTLLGLNVFKAGVGLGQGVEIHYGPTNTTAIDFVPGTAGLTREHGVVFIDQVDSTSVTGTLEVRVEQPYRRTPTGPQAGTWYRDEIARFTVTGDFVVTYETASQFQGLTDGINYCTPEAGS